MSEEYEKLKAQYERLELLYQVSNVIHSTLEPAEALQLILRETVRLTRATSGSVVLVNPNTGFLEIHSSLGLSNTASQLELRVGQGITGWVARYGKPVRLDNAPDDPRYIPVRSAVLSELAVPLEVNGEVRGVINVDSEQRHAFTAEDQHLLEELSVQAAKVIHHTWLYEQLRVKAQLFESLISVSQAINSTLNLDEALKVITREACQMMEAKMSSLRLLGEDQEWLELRASYGAGAAYAAIPRVSATESIMGTVIRRKKPLQVEDVQTSGRYQHVEMARQEGLVSLLSVPLVYRGRTTGALNVYTGKKHHFSNEEIRILVALAELSAIAIEKARLYERLVDVEEQLRQNEKLSALGLLAAEVAHEIRNPLTIMQMLYHSLNLDFPESDPRAKDAEVIRAKMDHLNKIVEQIVAFARNTEPKLEWINVNDLLEDLTLLTRHKLTNQQIELVKNRDPDLPRISGDPNQLEQVFLNLILNAVDAMPNGGTLTISTRLPRQKKPNAQAKRIVVEFADTGHGMSKEQQQKAFTSLLASSKDSGTGLGLAIVSKIVEAHRGRVQVRSQSGKGTKIQITLPVQ